MSPKSSGISTGAPGPQSPSQANKFIATSDAVLKNKDRKGVRASEDTQKKGSSDENVTTFQLDQNHGDGDDPTLPTGTEDDVGITALHSPKREETDLMALSAEMQEGPEVTAALANRQEGAESTTPIKIKKEEPDSDFEEDAMSRYTCAGSLLRTVSPPAAVRIKTEPEESAQYISAEDPSPAMSIKTEPEEEHMRSRSTSPDDRFDYQSIIHTPAVKHEEGEEEAERAVAKAKQAESAERAVKAPAGGSSKKRKAEEQPEDNDDQGRSSVPAGKKPRQEEGKKRANRVHDECENQHSGPCWVPYCDKCRNRHKSGISCDLGLSILREKLEKWDLKPKEQVRLLPQTNVAEPLPRRPREDLQQQQQQQYSSLYAAPVREPQPAAQAPHNSVRENTPPAQFDAVADGSTSPKGLPLGLQFAKRAKHPLQIDYVMNLAKAGLFTEQPLTEAPSGPLSQPQLQPQSQTEVEHTRRRRTTRGSKAGKKHAGNRNKYSNIQTSRDKAAGPTPTYSQAAASKPKPQGQPPKPAPAEKNGNDAANESAPSAGSKKEGKKPVFKTGNPKP